jgi:hypothetical protein
MFMKLIALFALLSMAFVAHGQGLKAVTQHYKPGDTLHYRVEFDGDPKFDGVTLGFYLQGNSRPDQPGLNGYFATGHMTKVSPGIYDLDGTIPLNAPDGTYEVHWVNAALGPASKQYDATDLKITIQVNNDAKYDFPPLKSITPE